MTEFDYGVITSIETLETILHKLVDEGKVVGFDCETGYYGPDVEGGATRQETNILAGFSFTNSDTWARYVPVNHDLEDNLDEYEVARLLWSFFKSVKLVAHNQKFELRQFSRLFREHLSDHPLFGKDVRDSEGYFETLSDSMIESYVLAENKMHNLKDLVFETFGHKMTKIEELFPLLPTKKQLKCLRFNTLSLEQIVVDYACEDALWCLKLHKRNYARATKMSMYPIEMEISRILCDMEDFGVFYDWEFYAKYAHLGKDFLDELYAEILRDLSELSGREVTVNLKSPAQLKKLFYEELGWTTNVITKTGNLSTGAVAMVGLAKKYPVAKKITVWKQMSKLLGTFLEKYESKYAYASDGQTHPGHIQAALAAGRFAVTDPPYQQCLPGDYEVLTPKGWVRFDALPDGLEVAQYHTDGSVSFIVPEVFRGSSPSKTIVVYTDNLGSWEASSLHRFIFDSAGSLLEAHAVDLYNFYKYYNSDLKFITVSTSTDGSWTLDKEPVSITKVEKGTDKVVYCVTVPTGLFVCRNTEGFSIVTGNSPKKYNYVLDSGKSFIFNFREGIGVPDGYYLLGFDVSQGELRVLTGFTQDPYLVDAYNTGKDLHMLTASLALGIPVDAITDEQRGKVGKMLNFSSIYGVSKYSLADRLGISEEEAGEILDNYFSSYSKVRDWMDEQKDHGKTYGYVWTKLGRKVPIWELSSDNWKVRNKGSRMCVNQPVQGTLSDVVKIMMIKCTRAIKASHLRGKVHLFMNIHDALEFAVHESVSLEEVMSVLKPAASVTLAGFPEFVLDWHTGKRWGSAEDIEQLPDGSYRTVSKEEKKRREEERKAIERARRLFDEPDEEEIIDTLKPLSFIEIYFNNGATKEDLTVLSGLLDEHPGPIEVLVRLGSETIKSSKTVDMEVVSRIEYKLPTCEVREVS